MHVLCHFEFNWNEPENRFSDLQEYEVKELKDAHPAVSRPQTKTQQKLHLEKHEITSNLDILSKNSHISVWKDDHASNST